VSRAVKRRAVFFDAGETLLSPHPSFHELFTGALASRGIAVDPEAVRSSLSSIGPTMAEVVSELGVSAWSTSAEASRHFWGRVYARALASVGVEDPEGELGRALYARFTQYDSYRLFPDAIPTLTALRAAGIFTGLISNFEDWLEGMLQAMEVSPLFDLMVISGKEGVEKPDPAIFLLALRRSGFSPAESVYVGDHPRIDAEGAEAVGMTAVLIDRRGHYRSHRGARIETLDQLLPMLDLS
jgi:putative hydrolase of the HAD superfamily